MCYLCQNLLQIELNNPGTPEVTDRGVGKSEMRRKEGSSRRGHPVVTKPRSVQYQHPRP